MDRRAYLATIGSLSAAGLAGCFGVGARDGPDHDVGMSTDAFRPERIEVAPGEPVVWRNTSTHAHTVTAYESGVPDGAAYFASGGFDDESAAREAWSSEEGGALYRGDVYEHTFEVPGEYHYFCVPHERAEMIGTVVVAEPEG